MENFKKNPRENKNKLRKYTLIIIKILRTASLGSNFTGSYRVYYNLHYYKRLVPKYMKISV